MNNISSTAVCDAHSYLDLVDKERLKELLLATVIFVLNNNNNKNNKNEDFYYMYLITWNFSLK